MKIRSYIDRDSGHCYLEAILVTDKLPKPERLLLLIDTGAGTTTILDGDCARLGLDCKRLPKNRTPTMVVGGLIDAHMLTDVAFLFRDTDGNLQAEFLKAIEVIDPAQGGPRPSFSIMGVDLLRRFKRFVVDYENDEAFLER